MYGFPAGSDGKESVHNAGDSGLIPGSGRSPGRRHDDPLQYSCLENPMDRGPWLLKEIRQSVLKETSPEYSLEGLMLKLKFQYFGHLM